MTDEEIIAVIQANMRGERIQRNAYSSVDSWNDIIGCNPVWNFGAYRYRVKPKLLEAWSVVFHDGTMGDNLYHSPGAAENHAAISGSRIAHVREIETEE